MYYKDDHMVMMVGQWAKSHTSRMGHYCDTCGDKQDGGVEATTCRCAECFCEACWLQKFQKKYEKVQEQLYLEDGQPSEKEYYIQVDVEPPKCNDCDTPFEATKWVYYGGDYHKPINKRLEDIPKQRWW